MCSIFGVLEIRQDLETVRKMALRQSRLLRHRGPDWSGVHVAGSAVLAHERLSIVDVNTGAQPLLSEDGRQSLAVNGEIYNHQAIRDRFEGRYAFRTQSDCEVILPLYREMGTDFLDQLSGMYAFCLYDEDADFWMMARDPIGIIPLYYGHDANGQLYVASEMKALMEVCNQVHEFPPGHYWCSGQEAPLRWYRRDWEDFENVREATTDRDALRLALEDAVVSHLMTDVPYGVLLSGGLDSSITAALAARHAAMRVEEHEEAPAWWPRLHSFAIGLEGSPDLAAARRAADHIGTVHHGFTFTVQEGLDALEEVIYHLETYDVTTIRAATPMFLMARKIRAMGIKMVLSGEGADEIFGGYLYFHKAPDARAFHEETVRKLSRLHSYDCLRANKAMAAWGIEARVPFLDKEFLDAAMRINPADKMIVDGRIEKHVLREAFSDLLPEEIAWRQKEQFSDGVGYGWIDAVRDFTEEQVSDAEMSRAGGRFPHNPPASKEAYWFRSVFEQHFPLASAAQCVPGGPTVACSTPEAVLWDKALQEMNDPSGRAMRSVHKDAY
ncbi:MAG: asparagine synthase B [Xanthomonadales bacterium]|nr:asparagine synthase B [Gammaproteobacteria bacterium]MBT8051702.1 asparagine synthase B [Gammaproteobacteria bacterium]MBT8057937.1 asparagine synthase B [Gammaproteobacteria bacterium]NNJ78492.1 asparagine synthase B [Xanthomonadales bacterium]NNL05748.1 asparagine synthase B [Xanthomonadales bacterium]